MKSAGWAILCLLGLAVAACRSPSPGDAPTSTVMAATPDLPSGTPTTVSLTEGNATPTLRPSATALVASTVEFMPFVWPSPPAAKEQLSGDVVTADQQSTFDELMASQPLARNDIALVAAYKAADETTSYLPAAVSEVDPVVGSRQQFHIRNLDNNTNSVIEAELLAIGEHAYFWFDTHPSLARPDADRLEQVREGFDIIHDQIVQFFGGEDNPGIDGDARIHIVNASPLALCDVTEANLGACSKLGMFSAWDLLPAAVNPYSNEREMFVMNGAFFDNSDYLAVLAHEFRHMVEAHYDANDADWEVEGSAMLAKDLVGSPEDSIWRANIFLSNPDQQLNRWTDRNTSPYYGQSYLFNRYIYERLGPELYLDFARHPANGLQAIDDLSRRNGLPLNGHDLWLDWLVALAIHNEPDRPPLYSLPAEIGTASMMELGSGATALETTVEQYAADYYRIQGEGELNLSFSGSRHVRLLPVLPASGERMWLADRANFSQMRLTRAFDLSEVSQATLNYRIYHNIEQGYDFAYVSASTDGGRSWSGLAAPHMRGADAIDNPGDSALTPRFYTGDSQGWLDESIDLTPFTGQQIQIRFEYVTDPILTMAGLALDQISIPEIAFYDGAEIDAGWAAEGFFRASGYVPQEWALQLITWSNDQLHIEQLLLNPDQTITELIASPDGNSRPAILIVAAWAPMTLQPAFYHLELR